MSLVQHNLFGAALLTLAFTACGDPGQREAAHESLSLNLVERHPSLQALEFRATGSLAWLDDHTIIVLDRDDQQLVALELSSGSERRAARSGEGPGELTGGIAVLSGDAGVLVMDMNLRRVSQFDHELEFVRSQSIPGLPAGLVGWSGDTAVVLWMNFGREGPEPRLSQIDLVSGALRPRVALYGADGSFTAPASPNPFTPVFFSGVQSATGEWLVGQGSEYRIVVFDGGRAVESFGRFDLPEQFPTEEQKAAARERSARAGARFGEPPPGMRALQEEALEEPTDYFGPSAFSLDSEGRLWVITTRSRAGSTEVDIFGVDRRFLQVVSLRDRIQALAFRGSRVAALVERTAGEVEGFSGIDIYELGS